VRRGKILVALSCVLATIAWTTPAIGAEPLISANDGIAWDGTSTWVVPQSTNVGRTSALSLSQPPNPGTAPPGPNSGSTPSSLRGGGLGRVTPNIIFGADNRVAVGNNNTSYPYRAIVYIETGGGSWCSGYLYGPRAVATAAHCIYENGAYKNIGRIYAGRNGTSSPYGSCGWELVLIPNGWKQFEDAQWKYDYGTIVLNCTIGNTVGWLGYSTTTGNMNGVAFNLEGYPQDKPARTMWRSPGTITDVATDIFHFNADTKPGNSGGGMRKADNYVIGIYSHDSVALGFNAAVRFTSTVFNNLRSWRDARLVGG
jgi:glutamyl endopeptidase